MRSSVIIFSIFFAVFILISAGYSQDFEMTVTVNTDALAADAKDRVKDMKQQVEDYFNKNRFYDNSLFNENNRPGAELYKVKSAMQITFKGTNGFDNYDAQILILSQRIIDRPDKRNNPRYTTLFRILDERCKFTYNRSLPFIRNEFRFDSFLSLLDYYAFMILGFDQDSFFPKDHPKNRSFYFQKAFDICNKPMTDRTGWTETGGGSKPSRLQLVQELLNPKFDDFRNGVYEYHWLGIDSLGYTRDAYSYIFNAIEKMSAIKKKEVKTFNIDLFFEAKNLEIAETFLNYGDKSIYDKLSKLDPAHQRIYEDYKIKAK